MILRKFLFHLYEKYKKLSKGYRKHFPKVKIEERMYNEVVIVNHGIIMILGWHCNENYDDINDDKGG